MHAGGPTTVGPTPPSHAGRRRRSPARPSPAPGGTPARIAPAPPRRPGAAPARRPSTGAPWSGPRCAAPSPRRPGAAARRSRWLSDPRDRLALALDVDDLVLALRLARRLRPWFGVAKVGLELFAAAGPEAVSALTDEGYRVFLDLKLHDIPTTVRRAARVIGGLGVAYTTVHTPGGEAMVRAAVRAWPRGGRGRRAGTLRARCDRSHE